MAITNLLAPIPKWVLINNEGTVAGGGKLFTYRSKNKIEPKPVYQDVGGTLPWTNPIIFDLNGTRGPFYWQVNSADLSETYYLVAQDSDGNELWTLDNYFPPGAGGGGNVTSYIPILNYITNNQFIDHIDDTINPVGVTNLLIAPSNHKGFTPALINPIVGTNGVVGPDIRFVKNNTAATDQITFPLFPLASAPLIGDVTPVDYIRYQCTNSPLGETYKAFQFPICQKIKNLSNQLMTFGVWAAVTSTPVDINIYLRQYFGSAPTASAEVRQIIDTINLTTTWTFYPMQFTVPDVAGKSIGNAGFQTDDDAIYIQIQMPLGAPCDVLFTKPALYLGGIDPDLDFESYDQIDSINSTPRTGDIKTSLISSAPKGWVPMNDGTIGNVGSGATTRANADTFQLYKTIWDAVANIYAPVSTGRGATAVADFLAGKTLTLPLSLGRALAGAGSGSGLTPRFLGQNGGAETQAVTLATNNVPAHSHGLSGQSGTGSLFTPAAGGSGYLNAVGSSFTDGGVGLTNPPTPFSFPTIPPITFVNIFIKL